MHSNTTKYAQSPWWAMPEIRWNSVCDWNKLSMARLQNLSANSMFNPTQIVIEAFIRELRTDVRTNLQDVGAGLSRHH